MNNVTWVVTCMDPMKARLLLRWLPKEPWPWVKSLVFITHRDREDLRYDLTNVAVGHGGEWPISIKSDGNHEFMLRRMIAPPALETFFQHSLGVKILTPLVVDSPLLFTDDDIVVTRDPSYLLKGMRASYSGLDAYGTGQKDTEGLAAINHAFEMSIDLQTYNGGRSDEAVWYLPDFDRDAYVHQLHRYFTHPHVVGVSQDKGTAPFGHTQRFRKAGMRFFSGYTIWRGGKQLRSPNYRPLAEKRPPKSVPNATFIHYCASGAKELYMDLLWRNAPEIT